MLRNYLKTAYRTLRSRPGITTINVLGLAVGLAVCACTGLYVADELSYDDFHPTAERLNREDDVTIVQVAHSKKQASYGDHIVELANRKIEDDCRIGEMGPTAKV